MTSRVNSQFFLLPQLSTLEAKELIKHTARLYTDRKQYKKTPSIKQKQQETQTDSKHTQWKMLKNV